VFGIELAATKPCLAAAGFDEAFPVAIEHISLTLAGDGVGDVADHYLGGLC
jgi:hypothetical protein